MAKQVKTIEKPEVKSNEVTTPKRRGSKPKHDWTKDLHPYYKLMDEAGISVVSLYRNYFISQPSLNQVVNYKPSYLRTLIEMKLIVPAFDIIDYIVQYYKHNQENFKNPVRDKQGNAVLDFDEEIKQYCLKKGLVVEGNSKNSEAMSKIKQENNYLKEQLAVLKLKVEELEAQLEKPQGSEKSAPRKLTDEEVANFFENLENMFNNSGLSQRAFVTHYGLPRTTTRRYLAREVVPSLEAILNFSEKLGIDLLKKGSA